jgi:hypothetical protein
MNSTGCLQPPLFQMEAGLYPTRRRAPVICGVRTDVWLSKCKVKRNASRFANGIGELWYEDPPPHMKEIACNH